MGAIDFTGLTLNPDEARSVSELVFEQAFDNVALNEVHVIQKGIERDKYIPIFGNIGLVGKLSLGCAQTDSGAQIETSEKEWTPKEIAVRLSHCKTDVPALFKAFERKQRALDYNLEGSQEMAFLSDQLLMGTEEAIWRIAWFNDTAADNVSGGGVITNGVDKTFFNIIDGLWKQIFTAVAAASVTKVAITENAGASYAAQDNLAIDTAYETLKKMYNQADSRLRSDDNAIFILSDSLVSNWEDFMENKSLNFTLQRTEEGNAKYTYRGKKIVRLSIWDRMIRAYEDNGTTWNLPHRAVFTTPGNIPIGTLSEKDFKEVDSFYDRTTKKNILDAVWTEDAKVLQEYGIIVAY